MSVDIKLDLVVRKQQGIKFVLHVVWVVMIIQYYILIIVISCTFLSCTGKLSASSGKTLEDDVYLK